MLIKKILVPTDFSATANYALEVAVQIAPKLSGEIHLYHRIHLPPQWNELSESERKQFPESYKKFEDAQAQLKALQEKYVHSNIQIKTVWSSGSIIKAIPAYVKQENIFMIIMGSQGADGFDEMAFGSNAQKIVRHAQCPVLVTKHPIKELDFKKLVFASDFQDSAKVAFKQLIEFGRHFGSHIHLLYVAAHPKFKANEEDKRRMKEFEKMCWALPCFIHETRDVELEWGIANFVQNQQADLVALAHYHKTPIQRLFTRNLTETLVNHLEQAVLSINVAPVKEFHTES